MKKPKALNSDLFELRVWGLSEINHIIVELIVISMHVVAIQLLGKMISVGITEYISSFRN